MKIRNGFVSNSSSSSFLVFFPEKITNYQQLYDLMWTEKNEKYIQKEWKFNDLKFIKSDWNTYPDSFKNFQKDATKYVLKEINKQEPNDYLSAIDKFNEEYYIYDGHLFGYGIEDEDGLELDQIKDISAEETLNEIKSYAKRHKEMIFYTFTFSDESGLFFEILERGHIFGNLPVYIESHH